MKENSIVNQIHVNENINILKYFVIFSGFCSHNRSYVYYAESIISTDPKAFQAVSVKNWDSFRDSIFEDDWHTVQMGFNCPVSASGKYYLQTNHESPYSLGTAGTTFKTDLFHTKLYNFYNADLVFNCIGNILFLLILLISFRYVAG